VSYVGEHETDSGDESSEESEVEEEEMVVSTCSVFIKNESGGVTEWSGSKLVSVCGPKREAVKDWWFTFYSFYSQG
jgi:hypothetical protein